MKRCLTMFAALVAAIAPSIEAQAEVVGSSVIRTTDFVMNVVSGSPASISGGATISNLNIVNLGSTGFTFDGTAAFLGNGSVSEDDFSTIPTGATFDYARADTMTMGDLLAAGGGAGVNSTTYADIAIDSSIPEGDSLSSSSTSFNFTVTAPVTVSFDFDTDLALSLVSDGTTAGTAIANSSFSYTLTGTSGGAAGLTVSLAPSELQQTITQEGAGTTELNFADSFTTGPVMLPSGTYSFVGSQTSDVSFAAVPEPGSLAFLAVAGVGAVAYRRRKKCQPA